MSKKDAANQGYMSLLTDYLEYGHHLSRFRRRRRGYAPTRNTAGHDNHQKINSRVSLGALYSIKCSGLETPGIRITFKVLLLTFKALNNLVPPYLSQLIVPYNPTRNLRSAGKHLLEVPNVRLKSYGDRAFSVAAPKLWNEIPLDIKLSRSVDVFKSRLKTYLFRLAFN